MNGKKAPARAVAMIALLLAISLLLTACGDTGKAEEVVKKFFSCVKAGDIDGAISCYTPEFQQSWQAGMYISEGLLGLFGISDGSSLINGLLGGSDYGAYQNYDFKIADSTKTDEDHIMVSVDVLIDGERSRTTQIYCVRVGKEWYIEE